MAGLSIQDEEFRKKIEHFVASKADLLLECRGKERLRSGIEYNVDGSHEAYSLFASGLPFLENGMQISSVVRRAHIFEIVNVGDIILGKVVGKRPFGVFVRILSLVHGRNLDFNNIDIQALCHKSELQNDRKSREHLDPIDDFEIDDIVKGVICSLSKDEERISISFRPANLPPEYGNVDLGIIEDLDEEILRPKCFDEDFNYNDCLKNDPGFSNPTNVQTLIDVLGIDSQPPNSLLRSCQRWKFSDNEVESLRKQQSKKWSMDTTATGVENFKSGEHEKALKYFNHALQIYNENSEAMVARGALYANQNKLEHAIKDFKQALKLHPNHHNARKYLQETLSMKALRLKNVGDIKEAMGTFEEVLELEPNNTECQKHLDELKSWLAAKLTEEKKKAEKALLLEESRKKFERVRKLIKADPQVAKNKKKKRKKKKFKKKKRRRRSDSETTDSGSEVENEWVEKKEATDSRREVDEVFSGLKENLDEDGRHSELEQSQVSIVKVEQMNKEKKFEEEESNSLAFEKYAGEEKGRARERRDDLEDTSRRRRRGSVGSRDSTKKPQLRARRLAEREKHDDRKRRSSDSSSSREQTRKKAYLKERIQSRKRSTSINRRSTSSDDRRRRSTSEDSSCRSNSSTPYKSGGQKRRKGDRKGRWSVSRSNRRQRSTSSDEERDRKERWTTSRNRRQHSKSRDFSTSASEVRQRSTSRNYK